MAVRKYDQGKPFQLPKRHQSQINASLRLKDKVVNLALIRMKQVTERAVDDILRHAFSVGTFSEPSFNGMSGVLETFYRDVVSAAWHTSSHDFSLKPEKKRLAKGPRLPPKSAQSLNDLFSNSRYWRSVMKRSNAMTQRMRAHYLRKLKEKFKEIMPLIRDGEISPDQAKSKMAEAWKTTKSRVETIFRTETTHYFARSQISYFESEPEIIGFLFDSVRDTARTEICKSRHGLVFLPGTKILRENTPALHYNCRSHLIPLANTEANRKLLEDEGRKPSNRKMAPLPKNWKK